MVQLLILQILKAIKQRFHLVELVLLRLMHLLLHQLQLKLILHRLDPLLLDPCQILPEVTQLLPE